MKKYTTPKLTVHGTVESLTKAAFGLFDDFLLLGT